MYINELIHLNHLPQRNSFPLTHTHTMSLKHIYAHTHIYIYMCVCKCVSVYKSFYTQFSKAHCLFIKYLTGYELLSLSSNTTNYIFILTIDIKISILFKTILNLYILIYVS